MEAKTALATKRRLVAAASELFAERGFHGTKVRDIAARAGVNLASGHYHFGSKKALYLEVLRAQFAEIHDRLNRGGASRPADELRNLSRTALADLLRARAMVMLDLLIGPPPGMHGTLMQREMSDPSEALPIIVDEFIEPLLRETEQIIAQLAPDLERAAVERCVFSVVGQALFYRFAMPAVLRLAGRPAYTSGWTRQLADHIAAFSLGGIERVAAEHRGSRHDR